MTPMDTIFSSSQCRICLDDGDIPIFDDEDSSISEDILLFTDIQVHRDDDFPKHICDSCFQLLMGAIVFRNSAKHSDKLLKNAICTNDDSIASNVPLDISESSNDIQDVFQSSINDTESIRSVTVNSDCFSTIDASEANENETVIMVVDDQSDSEDTCISVFDDTNMCHLCNVAFESIEDYQKHIKSEKHTLNAKKLGETNSGFCDEITPQERYEIVLPNNEDTDLLNILECVQCEVEFETMEEFEEHCNTEMHKNSFKKITNSSQLQKVKCSVCEKFVSKYYLKMHMKLHGEKEEKEELLRQCPYCKKYLVYSYLKAHIDRMHHDEEIPPKQDQKKTKPLKYICDKCGKVLKTQHSLNLHILTHGSELGFKCMFCPYRGLHASLLKSHVRRHTKDYDYKCTECPAKFLTKSNLSKHLKRHSGPGDFQCQSCDKCFYSKPQLEQHHEAVHLGLKKHICNICGKAFSYRNYMMCHQLKFHKRKKFTDGKGRLPSYIVNEIHNANTVENETEIVTDVLINKI